MRFRPGMAACILVVATTLVMLPAGEAGAFELSGGVNVGGIVIGPAPRLADPGLNDGLSNTLCNTCAGGGNCAGNARSTGILNSIPNESCVSGWGAEDMIGNQWELTADWYASIGSLGLTYNGMPVDEPSTYLQMPWPDASYKDDRTWGILSAPQNGKDASGGTRGLPSVAIRGGCHGCGATSGIFALFLYDGPSFWGPDLGFRCLISRR